RRAPRVAARPAQAREQDDGRESRGQDGRARVVDAVVNVVGARLERGPDHPQRDQPEREIDVEDPLPAQVVDEEAAEERTYDGGDAEHRAEQTLVATALPWGNDVADLGQRG